MTTQKSMTVQELITELSKYDPNTEVLITDGMNAYCYKGQYKINTYTDLDNKTYVDIGIGGCMENN